MVLVSVKRNGTDILIYMSETNDSYMSETNDAYMSETNDSRMSEKNASSMSETQIKLHVQLNSITHTFNLWSIWTTCRSLHKET